MKLFSYITERNLDRNCSETAHQPLMCIEKFGSPLGYLYLVKHQANSSLMIPMHVFIQVLHFKVMFKQVSESASIMCTTCECFQVFVVEFMYFTDLKLSAHPNTNNFISSFQNGCHLK